MATNTTFADPPKPLDLRTIPLWMVPQLAFLRDRLNATIVRIYPIPSDASNWKSDESGFHLFIPGEGYYMGRINKADMNNPHVVAMYNTLWNPGI